MSEPRKPLSAILPGGGNAEDILDTFDTTEAAEEFVPLPKGTYVAVAVEGGMTEAKTGTKGYGITFKVMEGQHANRRLWRTWYFTRDALPYTKRDLIKFGLDGKAKFYLPFPAGRFVCKLTVALRTLDDGTTANEIKTVEVVRVQEPQRDPFAPEAGGEDFPFGANGGIEL